MKFSLNMARFFSQQKQFFQFYFILKVSLLAEQKLCCLMQIFSLKICNQQRDKNFLNCLNEKEQKYEPLDYPMLKKLGIIYTFILFLLWLNCLDQWSTCAQYYALKMFYCKRKIYLSEKIKLKLLLIPILYKKRLLIT